MADENADESQAVKSNFLDELGELLARFACDWREVQDVGMYRTYESETTSDDQAEGWGVHGSSTGELRLSSWGWCNTGGGNGSWLCDAGGSLTCVDGDGGAREERC